METLTTPPNPFIVDGALEIPSFQEWFFWPGDWAIYLLARHVPTAAEVLGVGPADYGGTFAGLAAWIFWLVLALALIATVSAVRRFDRAVTRGIVAAVVDMRRRMRMAIAFARYRQRLRSQRLEPTFEVEEHTLQLKRNMR